MKRSISFVFLAALLLAAPIARANTISGTVTFQGTAVFAAPIAGIAYTDLTVSAGPGIEATGNGEHCDIATNDTGDVAADGSYTDTNPLAVGLEITKNGMGMDPDGTCLVQLRAYGNDGMGVSAYGTVTVEVTVAQIMGSATVVSSNDIVVRQSKTQAGLVSDCLKWVKKQTKLRGKCNATLWKLGGAEGSLKCKDAGLEPASCDTPNYVESVVALSFGDMNQQTNPPAALAVDLSSSDDADEVIDQAKCQRYIGKGAANFFSRRNQLVQKTCVDTATDTDACRSQATADSRSKLDVIDNCVTAQLTDVNSGLEIMDVEEPCRASCIVASTLDRKCLKDCLQLEVSTLSDGLMGDVPVCGNGLVQGGETCDDGNVLSGDCCSSSCQTTAPSAEGPNGNANCSDGIDNDCDGFLDGADPDCL